MMRVILPRTENDTRQPEQLPLSRKLIAGYDFPHPRGLKKPLPGNRNTKSLFALLALFLTAGDVPAGDPPPGPPWRMDHGAARREALRRGCPVFVYFTKTY